jgi:glycosyltransferase involved in cell wall biosynthesis
MKILLASSSSGSRGGGELYLLYLGRALAERGHEVGLWASSHPRMDELAQNFATFGAIERCDYTNTYDRRLRSLASYFDGASATRVAKSWRRAGADFIHINKQNLEDGLDLIVAARRLGAPSLATIHLSQSAYYLRAVAAKLRDAVSRRALRSYGGLLVTVLENRRRDLDSFLGGSPRVRMIPNGVPIFDLTKREALRAATRGKLGFTNEIVIAAVGRLVPQKRPLTFLEQARFIVMREPQARFVWVGDGELAPAWDARVAELGLGDVVRRLPWQNDVPPFLFAADIFLHVAEFEGLPLAILEAMSAGLPCAISNHLLAEMPFFGRDDVLGVGEDAAWAAALREPARLIELGARARRIAEDHFSFAAMAASYEALYRETLEAQQ